MLRLSVVHKRIALVGQPNSGKSTLFNVLSDLKTSTSNFPGTTVSHKSSLINVNFNTYELIDLPGTYSLNPVDKAEELTVDYIMNSNVDLIINVVDSTLLARSIELTIELLELGVPIIIALNLQDEADRYGVQIDEKKLSEILNVPVIKTSALFGKGIKELIEMADSYIGLNNHKPKRPTYSRHIEDAINKLQTAIQQEHDYTNISSWFYAVRMLENPELIKFEKTDNLKEIIKEINSEAIDLHHQEFYEIIASERHHIAMSITHDVSKINKKKSQPWSDKLDTLLLNPIAGYFFVVMFFILYFVIIFEIGNFLSELFDPIFGILPTIYEPLYEVSPFIHIIVDGIWQGIGGAFGIILPYFLPLLILTSIFESTGYMARIAFLLDGLFHRIGLHGKSIVPFILGFGCTVPAIYATRIIDNQRDRLITGVLINFIPCSARLMVIFALSAAFTGPLWTAGIFALIVIIISVNGKILSFFMTKPTGMVMEIPSLKLPTVKSIYMKTYYSTKEFFKAALPLLVVGSIVLSLLDYFKLSEWINYILSPVITVVLGLPEQLGSTLIFGFLRKELIIVMASNAMNANSLTALGLTVNQAVTFTLFIILYIPCVATFGVLLREFGRRATITTAIFTFSMAIFVAVFVRFVLLFLGIA